MKAYSSLTGVKQNSRKFKLSFARNAIRQCKGEWFDAITLCGDNLKFETKLSESAAKNGIRLALDCFNSTEKELDKAMEEAENCTDCLEFHNSKLTPGKAYKIKSQNDNSTIGFVDFDCCSQFFAATAKTIIGIAQHTRLMAITLILKGRHPGEENIILPDGMSKKDCEMPDKIGEYLEDKTGLYYLGKYVYKNGIFPMVTIIIGDKKTYSSKSEPMSEKIRWAIVDAISKGKTNGEMISELCVTGNQIGNVKALLKMKLIK